jgi:hypothetical protein
MKAALNRVCGEPYLQIVIPPSNELTMPSSRLSLRQSATWLPASRPERVIQDLRFCQLSRQRGARQQPCFDRLIFKAIKFHIGMAAHFKNCWPTTIWRES